jgi:acetoin:2,6-dichlorophenolindophenol oxidoreductase subunit beta
VEKMPTVRDTIKNTVRFHLKENKGLAMGQCLTAVGWVGGTLPELYEDDGMVELSMADVAGGGFAVGAALAGRRPMYVIRYQGFNWYNAPMIVNYAAKSKDIWGVPCPMFVRSIAMEGGIGPVAGSSHHALYYRMPGVRIVSPMTPKEYMNVYDDFMHNDDVFYVSEHRGSYNNQEELPNLYPENPHISLFPISITRFAAQEAAFELAKEGINVSVHHIMSIKPLRLSKLDYETLAVTGKGIVLDDDYTDGIAKSIAYDIARKIDSKLEVMGLDDRTAGFYPQVDNLPPSKEKIIAKIREMLK